MIEYGNLIVQQLKNNLPPYVHVQADFPDQWAQFSAAVFVLFNGYQIMGQACKTVHVATYWQLFIAVKNAGAQTDKTVLDLEANTLFDMVYSNVVGRKFNSRQIKPVYLNDRVTIPEYLPNVGIFPLGVTIETKIGD